MQKRTVYPGAIPLDLDWLEPQRNTEIALGFMMRAAFGTSTVIDGLAVTQQSSPNMTVQVGPGAIIVSTTVDPTGVAYGSLALDTSNLVKIGINTAAVNMSALTAPGVAGQSQNWLLEAQFLETDTGATVLPYYNASNPSVPYSGPANAGTTNTTRRTNTVQLQWKAGTAAATGQQNTPTPDAGWVGVTIVTVANGQSSILNSHIMPYSAAPFVPTKLAAMRTRLTSALTIYVSTFGNDSNNSGLSASSPFLTLQKAWNYIVNNVDLNGNNVTISVANGTYTAGVVCSGAVLGLGSGNTISFVGNTGSPSSVVVSAPLATSCFQVTNGATITVSGFTLNGASTSYGLNAWGGSSISASSVIFGANGTAHVAAFGGAVTFTSGFTVTGGAGQLFLAQDPGSKIGTAASSTITMSGTPAFSGATVLVQQLGFVNLASGTTFSGSATGTKYSAQTNGVIQTAGLGPANIPGSVAGGTSNGGVAI